MFELINNHKEENIKHRVTSFGVSYLKFSTIFYGMYTENHVLHNLRIKTKQNIKEEFSHKTYVRGGKTDWNFFNDDPDFNTFLETIFHYNFKTMFPNFERKDCRIVDCWGNYLVKNNEVKPHTHPSYHGILYLTEGNPIVFPEAQVRFVPAPGKFIIAPPELTHYVEPIQEETERLNIIFNFELHDGFRKVNEDSSKKSL